MTLDDIKRRTLMLINQYSTDGTEVSESDNADYLLRIPDLATMAQNEIAKIQPIVTSATLSGTPDEYGNYYTYDLPSDFIGLEKVEYVYQEVLYRNPLGWFLVPPDKIAVKETGYTWTIYYRKQPAALEDDTDELEVALDGQDAIPYFCASNLLLDEDAGVATFLINQYYARLANLRKSPVNTRVRNGMGW